MGKYSKVIIEKLNWVQSDPNRSRLPDMARAGFITVAHGLGTTSSRNTQRAAWGRLVCSVRQSDGDGFNGVRVNKCFKAFASRRQADGFIMDGRVRINGKVAVQGDRVNQGDEVKLDGKIVEWERLNVLDEENLDGKTVFRYLKYWKPARVVCTMDERIENSLFWDLEDRIEKGDRVFPVGRLDEMSTGLLLLTNDGRIPKAVLGRNSGCEKEYLVTVDKEVTDTHLKRLTNGVEITTVMVRGNGERDVLTAKTLPCRIEREGKRRLKIGLKEGRNRQIRKMLGKLGYTALNIHRVAVMGITLSGLERNGDIACLDESEMRIIQDVIRKAQ